MKKTQNNRRFLVLILTIILIVVCFPTGVLAEPDDRNGDKLKVNEDVSGVLLPIITFSNNVVYNGNQQSLAVISPDPDSPELDPGRIEITYKGINANGDVYSESTVPPTDAGIYTVMARYKGDDTYANTEETKEIQIKPIALKTTEYFTDKPISKIYDGNINVPENTTVELKNKGVLTADLSSIAFTYKSANFLSKDVKSVTPNVVILKDITVTGNKKNNYTIIEEKNEVKPINSITVSIGASIMPKPIEVMLSGQDKVYDGTSNLYDFELSINQDDLIKGEEVGAFGAENFYPYYGEISIQQKDVGNYYVGATGGFYLYGINGTNVDNYMINNETIISKKKYAITPASVTVIPSYNSKIQGDTDPLLPYVVWQDESGDGFTKGLYSDDVLYGSLEREEGEAEGSYDVYLGSLNNANYFISIVDGGDKFEILKGEEAIAAYSGNDYYNHTGGVTVEEKSKVAYFRIALLGVLIIAGGIFFGKNRLTNM